VTVTSSASGCTTTAIASLNISNTPPGASATGGTLTSTATSVALTAATTSGTSFNWAGPGIVSGGNTANPTVSSSGTYTVTVTNSANGCTSTATAPVNVLDNFLVEAAGGGAIPTQAAGVPFNIRITARDAGNNTVTSFSDSVVISSTGTLSGGGGVAGGFVNGVLSSQSVTIANSGSFTITATRKGGAESGTSNAFTVNPVVVRVKVILQGPYNGTRMDTLLTGMIPHTQPYNITPWSYAGAESVATVPPSVVDWVLVQLRSDSATTVATRAAFLKSDGSVVDTGGSVGVRFGNISAGNYFIVIRHRNHLAIMSAAKQSASGASASSPYDFTTGQSQAFGTDPMLEVSTGVFGMICGDVNQSGIVSASDANAVFGVLNATGYNINDVNLSGIVSAADANKIFGNLNQSTQVPP
jgi:hypothetical protein